MKKRVLCCCFRVYGKNNTENWQNDLPREVAKNERLKCINRRSLANRMIHLFKKFTNMLTYELKLRKNRWMGVCGFRALNINQRIYRITYWTKCAGFQTKYRTRCKNYRSTGIIFLRMLQISVLNERMGKEKILRVLDNKIGMKFYCLINEWIEIVTSNLNIERLETSNEIVPRRVV